MIGDLEWEPCAVCETKPSYYREKMVREMTGPRRLSRRCYGPAIVREQTKAWHGSRPGTR